MERLLHYIWKYKLYSPFNLRTTDGERVSIIDPGILNTDAGPDFFNAKIKIKDELWAGTVEIHNNSSDWNNHRHNNDEAYDSVILHVVETENARIRRRDGEFIPQLVLRIPREVKKSVESLTLHEQPLPCLSSLSSIPRLHVANWLEALSAERLQRKTNDILRNLNLCDNDWNEIFYISLARSLGVGVNSDAFERLAKSLPLRCIQKHRNNVMQVEAMLFGQAGILEGPSEDEYYKKLQQEYLFLRQKFTLQAPDALLLRSLRTRPYNFPHVKLAQIAAIWCRYPTLFSEILDRKTPADAMKLFEVSVSEYWQTHYHFQYSSTCKEKPLGGMALQIIAINTIVPVMMAYAAKNKEQKYADKALSWLHSMPPEKNSIVGMFAKSGIKTENAADSQALIQLKREYCEKKKCLYCRIGHQLLKQKSRYPL